MKIAVCQDAFRAGALDENFKKARMYYKKAVEKGADILVYPGQPLIGCNSSHLLGYSDYAGKAVKLQKKLIRETVPQTAVVFDTPFALDGSISPSILVAYDGCVQKTVSMTDTDDVSDNMTEFRGQRFFVGAFSDDMLMLLHHPEVVERADAVILLDARPLVLENEENRLELMDALSDVFPVLVYTNQSGGQQTHIMSGASSVYVKGDLRVQLPYFKPALEVCDIDARLQDFSPATPSFVQSNPDYRTVLAHDALVTVIADYFKNCHTTRAVVGLSGGIDSAVVLPLAVEALGRKNVFGIMMPSRFSSDHSVNDAVKLAENLQIYYEIIPIEPVYKAYLKQLEPVFGDTPFGLAEENLQARIRGGLLMAAANKHNAIVLNTTNKSESVCGYGTLYGDMVGGLSVLGDLYKSQVYGLARYINRKKEIIPLNSITKAPSAELRPGQKDSDSLPDYDLIERIMRMHLELHYDEKTIISEGCGAEAVKKVLGLFYRNGYKRRQAPPAIQISSTPLALYTV